MTCPKCAGLIGGRYDLATQQRERYCLNCGCLPDVICRRADGATRDEVLCCVKCKVQPRCSENGVFLRFCVACRVDHAEQMRMLQVRRRNAQNRKAKMGNIRVRRVA